MKHPVTPLKKFALPIISVFLFAAASAMAAEVPRMSAEELKSMLDKETVSILDVRQGRDWTSSEFKIKGAHRAAPGDFDSWSTTYPKENTLILYCA